VKQLTITCAKLGNTATETYEMLHLDLEISQLHYLHESLYILKRGWITTKDDLSDHKEITACNKMHSSNLIFEHSEPSNKESATFSECQSHITLMLEEEN